MSAYAYMMEFLLVTISQSACSIDHEIKKNCYAWIAKEQKATQLKWGEQHTLIGGTTNRSKTTPQGVHERGCKESSRVLPPKECK